MPMYDFGYISLMQKVRARTGRVVCKVLFKIDQQEKDREDHDPLDRPQEREGREQVLSIRSMSQQFSTSQDRTDTCNSDLDQSFRRGLLRSLNKANSSFSLSGKSNSSSADKESIGSSLSNSLLENQKFQDLLNDDTQKLCSQLQTEQALFSTDLVKKVLSAFRSCLSLSQAVNLVLDQIKECELPFSKDQRWSEVGVLFSKWQHSFVYCLQYVITPFAFVMIIIAKFYRGDFPPLRCLDAYVSTRCHQKLVNPQLFQFITQFLQRECQTHQVKCIMRSLSKSWREIHCSSQFKILAYYGSQEMDLIKKKYMEQDQFLRDSAEDLSSMFFEVESRMFLNLPLSSCFQSRAGSRTRLDAQRQDLFNLWLDQLILAKLAKNEAHDAWAYVVKVFQVAQLCYSTKINMPSLISLFHVMQFVHLNLKKLWGMQFKTYQRIFSLEEGRKLSPIQVPLMYSYFKKLNYKENVHAKEGFQKLCLGVHSVVKELLSIQHGLKEFRDRQRLKKERSRRLGELVFRFFYEELYNGLKQTYPDERSRREGLQRLETEATQF